MILFFPDPNPTFLFSPPFITKTIVSGSKVSISNVAYYSPFQIKKAYWLKNGKQRIDTTYEAGIILYGPDSNLPKYSIPDLTLFNVKLADQGYYQGCLELDNGKVYCSQKVSLKLTGKHPSQ